MYPLGQTAPDFKVGWDGIADIGMKVSFNDVFVNKETAVIQSSGIGTNIATEYAKAQKVNPLFAWMGRISFLGKCQGKAILCVGVFSHSNYSATEIYGHFSRFACGNFSIGKQLAVTSAQ